jgi:hypothetical protein
MDPIHSEVDARWLFVPVLNKRLDKANNFSEKLDSRQDLEYASMTLDKIERNSIANPGRVIEVPNLQNVVMKAMDVFIKIRPSKALLWLRFRQYSASNS